MSFSTPTSRWAALTTRNRLADSIFVYAVRTTKIYCRPSCSARLARRANVEFYNSPAAAAKAGYRPCKRCKPDCAQQEDPQDVAVARACHIIRAALDSVEHANGHIGLNELAGKVGLTPSYLHKTFKAKMGVTPKAYAKRLMEEMEAPAQTEEVVVPGATTSDGYPAFSNDITTFDFDLESANTFDAASDIAGLTSGGFSEGTNSITTPMTTDLSWLDTIEHDGYEFFDGDALARAILAHEQSMEGWNSQAQALHGENWDVPNADGRLDSFGLENDSGKTLY